MRPGTVLKLKTATLGILTVDGHRETISIPSDAVLNVVCHSKDAGMIDVRWEEKTLSIFAVDLRERGEIASAAVLTRSIGSS